MDDEIDEGQFEGIWYKASCPNCGEFLEVEEDIRGQVIDCDGCGEPYRVVGD